MKNLEFMELNAQELEDVNGGGVIKDIYEVLKDLDKNWDSLKSRFMDGWNSYER